MQSDNYSATYLVSKTTLNIQIQREGNANREIPVKINFNNDSETFFLPVDLPFSVIKSKIVQHLSAKHFFIDPSLLILFVYSDPLADTDTIENCASLVHFRSGNPSTDTALPPHASITVVQDIPINLTVTYHSRAYSQRSLSLSYYISSLIEEALKFFQLQGDSSAYHLSFDDKPFDIYQTLFGAHVPSGARLTLEEGPTQTAGVIPENTTNSTLATQSLLNQSATFKHAYTYIRTLSVTHHSQVVLCRMNHTNEMVAVKIVHLNTLPEFELRLLSLLLRFLL